jgi:hypothetical protein
LAGPYEDLVRAEELLGSRPLRLRLIRRPSTVRSASTCKRASPVIELQPAELHTEYNSAYANERNNGALWAGRGLATALSTGIHTRWGPFSAAFAPRILYHQNRAFETSAPKRPTGASPFSHPWYPNRIDWPVRFGARAFWTLDLGQSYLRLDSHGVALGLSNENLWWGPAARYPLLMSNNAPGFPHLYLGTARPLGTPLGEVEAQLIWGRLEESAYFDETAAGDRRLLAGLVLAYAPRGLPGLQLGAARVFMKAIPPEGLTFSEWSIGPFRRVTENPLGKDNPEADNQLISLFARWAFPEAGFEVYGEWSREDHWGDLKDLALEPDHSQAYVLGFQKTAHLGARRLIVRGESASLRSSVPQFNGRANPTMYTHGQLRQGYTHRGQLLGAAIGPGSIARHLGVDLITSQGLAGLFLEQISHNEDTFRRRWARYYGPDGRDGEVAIGFRQMAPVKGFELAWEAALARRRNRYFQRLDGVSRDFLTEWNGYLGVGLVWRPGRQGSRPPAASRSGDDGA